MKYAIVIYERSEDFALWEDEAKVGELHRLEGSR